MNAMDGQTEKHGDAQGLKNDEKTKTRPFDPLCKSLLSNRELSILMGTPLCAGMDEQEVQSLFRCLSGTRTSYARNTIVVFAGAVLDEFGIVLQGELQIIQEDAEGNATILAVILPGQLYGEAICYGHLPESPVTVLASEDSVVLRMYAGHLTKTCQKACPLHHRFIENMLFLLAQKTLFLQSRIDIIRNHSVRKKILLYLHQFQPTEGNTIVIPLNREQMAAFLSVDRSALSHELIRMKKEGLIRYHKNRFQLIHTKPQ